MNRKFISQFARIFLSVAVLGGLVLPSAALAGKPTLDSGTAISIEDPYSTSYDAGTSSGNHAVYGKLEGETPIDVIGFKADQDGEQRISLMVRTSELTESSDPLLVLIDPTDKTKAVEYNLPMPSSEYHSALIKQLAISERRTYNEPAIFEQFTVVAEEKITLVKDKQYYLFVLDPGRQAVHYTVKFGEDKAWTAGDIFKNFGTWLGVMTDTYAGTSPFGIDAEGVGLLIMFLGLISLLGFWLVSMVLALGANKSKASAYLLVKLQPFSTIGVWIGLWFTALGGYMFFSRNSWLGIPFVLILVFIPMLVLHLIDTLVLSKQIKSVEVSSKEASLPLQLRKKLYVTIIFNALLSVTGLVLLTMHLVGK